MPTDNRSLRMKISVYNSKHAPVAQWIEHLTSDQTVVGSNPAGGAYMWGLILDLPPHISVVRKINK